MSNEYPPLVHVPLIQLQFDLLRIVYSVVFLCFILFGRLQLRVISCTLAHTFDTVGLSPCTLVLDTG